MLEPDSVSRIGKVYNPEYMLGGNKTCLNKRL
jgi:hypothetical protein